MPDFFEAKSLKCIRAAWGSSTSEDLIRPAELFVLSTFFLVLLVCWGNHVSCLVERPASLMGLQCVLKTCSTSSCGSVNWNLAPRFSWVHGQLFRKGWVVGSGNCFMLRHPNSVQCHSHWSVGFCVGSLILHVNSPIYLSPNVSIYWWWRLELSTSLETV